MYTALDYENYIRSIFNVDTPSVSFREMNTGLLYHGEHSLLQARHLQSAMIIKSYTAVKYVNPNTTTALFVMKNISDTIRKKVKRERIEPQHFLNRVCAESNARRWRMHPGDAGC